MLTFFDLPTVLAIAEHTYTVSGEDHAALQWQLAGAPVLSAHPADPDKPPAQVYDDRWFSSRWPQLEIGDVTAHPLIHPHYTSELFPLTGTDQLLAALRLAVAGGWKLLAIDMDETEVTWYLAHTRRKKHPIKPLGQRDRRPQHPLLQALTAAGFFARNFPPGSDHWTVSKWGPRYQVSVTVDQHTIGLSCLSATLRDPAPEWRGQLRADVPADIAAAMAIATGGSSGTAGAGLLGGDGGLGGALAVGTCLESIPILVGGGTGERGQSEGPWQDSVGPTAGGQGGYAAGPVPATCGSAGRGGVGGDGAGSGFAARSGNSGGDGCIVLKLS